MRAEEMTFGIEIECLVPMSCPLPAGGGYHRGQPIPWAPAGWEAQNDASISAKAGYRSLEVVSPVLRGAAGLDQVVEVVKKLKEFGAIVNASCGFHVHVGAGFRDNRKALTNLVCLVGRFEQALFAITGSKARAQNRFCRPIRATYEGIRGNLDDATIRQLTRYHSLNLTNLLTERGTVEFRVFAGTLNLTKILGYIQVCLALAENAHAHRRVPRYTLANKRYVGRVDRQVYRMLRNFGWYAEPRLKRAGRLYGLLRPEALAAVKAEFKRLARKFTAP